MNADSEKIQVEDGRLFPRPAGVKTKLPNNEVVACKNFGGDDYMGEIWEFTGRIKYESNEGWSETQCFFEIVMVWDADHWLIPFKTVTKTSVRWIQDSWFKIEKEYDTVTTIVDCTEMQP